MKRLALLLVFSLLSLLLQPAGHRGLSAAPTSNSCLTTIDTPKLTPELPVAGRPTRITVRIADSCGAAAVSLGWQGPPPYDWGYSWAHMTRSGGTRYDGYWTFTIPAFYTGGFLNYSIKVRHDDGTESPEQAFLVNVLPAVTPTKVEVSPAIVTLDPRAAQQFTARGLDASGNEVPNLTFTWSVVGGGGTITSTGLFTAGSELNIYVETVKAETTFKAYSFDGKNWMYRDTILAGFATVKVACTLKRVEVYPANPTVPAGRTLQFTAKGFDCNNQEIPGLTFDWSAVDGGTISSRGLFTAADVLGTFPNAVRAEATHDGITKAGFASVTVGPPCPGPAPQPATYSGSVVMGFRAAPEGTKVVAKVGDYTSASVTTSGGRYTNLVIASPCSTSVGKTIRFYTDGVEAKESDVFREGASRTLDLTFGVGATIPLDKGWNLISFPTPQQDTSIAAAFGDVSAVTKVYTLDGERWLYAVRSDGGWMGSLTEVVDGRGYWVLAEQAASLRLRPAFVETASPYNDEFNSSTLDPKWSWVRENATHWSLTASPGNLRIVTQVGDIPERGTGWARNILLQAPPAGNFEMVTKVNFAPTVNYHQAGLIVYKSDAAFLRLIRLAMDGGQLISFAAATQGWGDFIFTTAPFTGTTNHLKIRRIGTTFSGYFSPDGITWTLLGIFDLPALSNFKIGLAAFNGWPTGTPEINAEFDYFRVFLSIMTPPVASQPAAPPALNPSPAYALSAGWNLVGYTSLTGVPTQPVATYFRGLDWTVVYRYSPARGYEEARPGGKGFTDVEAGKGYYIYLTAAGTLVP